MAISRAVQNTVSSFPTFFQPDLCDLNYTTVITDDDLCFRRGDFLNKVVVKNKSQKCRFGDFDGPISSLYLEHGASARQSPRYILNKHMYASVIVVKLTNTLGTTLELDD